MKREEFKKLKQLDRIEYMLVRKELELNPKIFSIINTFVYALLWIFLFAIIIFVIAINIINKIFALFNYLFINF